MNTPLSPAPAGSFPSAVGLHPTSEDRPSETALNASVPQEPSAEVAAPSQAPSGTLFISIAPTETEPVVAPAHCQQPQYRQAALQHVCVPTNTARPRREWVSPVMVPRHPSHRSLSMVGSGAACGEFVRSSTCVSLELADGGDLLFGRCDSHTFGSAAQASGQPWAVGGSSSLSPFCGDLHVPLQPDALAAPAGTAGGGLVPVLPFASTEASERSHLMRMPGRAWGKRDRRRQPAEGGAYPQHCHGNQQLLEEASAASSAAEGCGVGQYLCGSAALAAAAAGENGADFVWRRRTDLSGSLRSVRRGDKLKSSGASLTTDATTGLFSGGGSGRSGNSNKTLPLRFFPSPQPPPKPRRATANGCQSLPFAAAFGDRGAPEQQNSHLFGGGASYNRMAQATPTGSGDLSRSRGAAAAAFGFGFGGGLLPFAAGMPSASNLNNGTPTSTCDGLAACMAGGMAAGFGFAAQDEGRGILGEASSRSTAPLHRSRHFSNAINASDASELSRGDMAALFGYNAPAAYETPQPPSYGRLFLASGDPPRLPFVSPLPYTVETHSNSAETGAAFGNVLESGEGGAMPFLTDVELTSVLPSQTLADTFAAAHPPAA